MPAKIARLRNRLRATLETMGFRESGGACTPDICPACQEDRRGEKWFGRKGDPDRICQRCFMEGKPYPSAA